MKIRYSKLSKEQLHTIKIHISQDKPKTAVKYLQKIKKKIALISKFPFIGKINQTYSQKDIREFIVEGYKVI